MAIDLGDVYRLSVDHMSPAGDLVNADTMTLTVTLPDATTTSQVVAPGTTGKYVYDYPTVQPGRHTARWVGTGAGAGAYVETFDVRPENPGYIISLADAKAQTNIGSTASDEELRPFIEAATAVIERHTKETIARREVAEFRELDGPKRKIVLRQAPVISLTAVESVDGTTEWDLSGLRLNHSTGSVTVTSGGAFTGQIEITYVAGYQIVPANYSQAAKFIVQHLWTTQRGSKGAPRPAGGALDTPGQGFTSFGYAIPNAALEMLGPSMPLIA